MYNFKIYQTYYILPSLKLFKEKLIYKIHNLSYSYNQTDNELNINYILNIPLQNITKHILIQSECLNSEIKLDYSLYDDYLKRYLTENEMLEFKKTNISYLGKDFNKFPKYIIECINDENTSNDYKQIMLLLINCKKINIKKRLEIYNNLCNTYINLGNIFLKIKRNESNIMINEYAAFSSIFEIL